jgi:hypothetical protein
MELKLSHYSHGGVWEGRRYSSYSFLTLTLDGGEWSASRPGRALPSGKGPPVPIVQEAGWAPEPVWTQRLEKKSFAPAGNRTPIARSSIPYSDTILPELPRLQYIPIFLGNIAQATIVLMRVLEVPDGISVGTTILVEICMVFLRPSKKIQVY